MVRVYIESAGEYVNVPFSELRGINLLNLPSYKRGGEFKSYYQKQEVVMNDGTINWLSIDEYKRITSLPEFLALFDKQKVQKSNVKRVKGVLKEKIAYCTYWTRK